MKPLLLTLLLTLLLIAMPISAAQLNLPLYSLSNGQQTFYARSTWDNPATCIMFRCGRFNGAHHPTFDGGHFEMLRKGEWVLTRPRAYSDSGTIDGLGANNSLLLGNQPMNWQRREMLGAGETNGAYWMVQIHSGPWVHGNERTAEYVHSAKRWLVWIPGESDVLLVRDVLHISQPPNQTADRKAYNIGLAAARHAEYIESQATVSPIPLVQFVLHAPVKPSVVHRVDILSRAQWQTAGGQQVRLTAILPSGEQPEVILLDEANHYGGGVAAKERGWQVRVVPAGFEGGKVELLHAVTVGETVPVAVGPDGQAINVGGRMVSFLPEGVEVSP